MISPKPNFTKMKKYLKKIIYLTFLFIIFSAPVSAQHDFTKADSIAKSITEEDIELTALATQLTTDLSTEVDKARAIYMWIAGNIRYDCKKYHNPKNPTFSGTSKEEIGEKIAIYRQKGILKTLKRKRGVCEDYSRLFNALCKEVGLESIRIVGNARDFYKPYRKGLGGLHAWNAVKIDGNWYLIDATWGAGYTDEAVKRFTRRLSAGYFMVKPEKLIQTHFPEDKNWQLLAKPLNQKAFSKQPMVNIADIKYQIQDASDGIETNSNGKRMVRFKFKNPPKYLFLSNRKSKPIAFKKRIEGEYVILEFSSSSAKKIVVWGGNSRKKLTWMAMYKA